MLQFIERKIKAVNVTLMTGFIVVSVIAIMIVTCTIATISYNSISALNSINLLSVQKSQEIKRLDKLISKVREFHSNVGDYVITRDSSYLKNTATDKRLILTLTKHFADSLVDRRAQQDMPVLTDLI
jgi:CHASE3 domain sensor protein